MTNIRQVIYFSISLVALVFAIYRYVDGYVGPGLLALPFLSGLVMGIFCVRRRTDNGAD
jgi:hypothetical protein